MSKRKHTALGVQIGPLSNNSTAARHYVPPEVHFPAPDRVLNATMPPGSLDVEEARKLWRAPARAGADQFRKFRSVGGC